MAKYRVEKKAGIKRGNKRNPKLPRTKVTNWGLSKVISEIDRVIDLIYRRK